MELFVGITHDSLINEAYRRAINISAHCFISPLTKVEGEIEQEQNCEMETEMSLGKKKI